MPKAHISINGESLSSYIDVGKNCAKLYESGERKDGVYIIDPDNSGSFQIWCDMQTDGGGWAVFQRRLDASADFYRDWKEYKNGFGNLNGSFWLGLDKIHRLTKSDENLLRVDLMDFENDTAYAEYEEFSIASENENYTLNVQNFKGKAFFAIHIPSSMKQIITKRIVFHKN